MSALLIAVTECLPTASDCSGAAAAEEMRRRTPGVMRDPVEPSGGVDPREGIRGGEPSRRDRGEGRGAIVPLQGVEFPCCALPLRERRGDLGRMLQPMGAARALRADSEVIERPTARAARIAFVHSSAARRSYGAPAGCPARPPSPRSSTRREA